jgi:hypothetical protein
MFVYYSSHDLNDLSRASSSGARTDATGSIAEVAPKRTLMTHIAEDAVPG